MRKQPKNLRIKNFEEVALGFSEEEAISEAKRCLQCKQPSCIKGCPVEIDIPAFINFIVKKDFESAIKEIKEKNNLPAICGRVCPQEIQCERNCILAKKNNPINIGALERYVADWQIKNKVFEDVSLKPRHRLKVAVIGSGPAGLSCAAELAKIGYSVTVFESLHLAGGVLMYGIPEFRLPKKILSYELDYIRSLGVEIKTDTLIGKTYTLDDLFKKRFLAIFIATGAGLPQFLGIPGENAGRVYSANEFLTRINLMRAHLFPRYSTPLNIKEKIAVVGGGNVAFDCARVGIRLGKKVILIYRRTEKEMPARREEIENAKEEGVNFMLLTQPIEIIKDKDGFIEALKCIKMRLGEPDSSGRRRPLPIKNSEFILHIKTLIVAIGQRPNPLLPRTTPSLKTNLNGTIWVNDELMTNIKGIFAGGDIVTGADTVISAMGAGKKAAFYIDKYIKSTYY